MGDVHMCACVALWKPCVAGSSVWTRHIRISVLCPHTYICIYIYTIPSRILYVCLSHTAKDICAISEMNVTATTVPARHDIYSTSIVSMNSTSIVSMNSTSIVSMNSTMQGDDFSMALILVVALFYLILDGIYCTCYKMYLLVLKRIILCSRDGTNDKI